MGRQRSLQAVPLPVTLLLLGSLLAQLTWHWMMPPPRAVAQALPPAIGIAQARALSFGEPQVVGKLAMLWLQAFDNQPGVSIPFRDLDYARVTAWLRVILELDPKGQYPLLAASRLYGEIPDEAKQRQMLEFTYEQFFVDPNRRWPWLAHAAHVAKHRLGDLPMALKYAQAVSRYTTDETIPGWAKQMHIFLTEESGELESAEILLGALLDSGKVSDANEQQFLHSRLAELRERLGKAAAHAAESDRAVSE